MTAPVLADALGPQGRRRVLIATVVTGVVLAGLLVVGVRRFADRGQLEWERWEPLTQWSVLKFLLLGLVNTIKAAALAMVLAVVLGALLALLRLTPVAPLRWFAAAWVEFFRGFPLLLLIFFMFLALPKYDIHLSPYTALVAALTLYNGAQLGEIFRAGILSLDRGQSEAGYAVGLTYSRVMAYVVVPQAARRMVPAIVSQLITLLKDTSLGYVITFEELLRRGRILGEFEGNILQAYLAVAALYIAVNFTLSRIARRLEVRQRRRLGAAPITGAGAEDMAVVGVQAEAATTRDAL
jgi:glutamate transport system permease protein